MDRPKDLPNRLECAYCKRNHKHGGECLGKDINRNETGCLFFIMDERGCIRNLTEDFKQEFKEEKVNISTAYELSKLPQEQQEEILKEYEEKGKISIKDVKEKIEDLPIQKGYEEENTLAIIGNDIVDTQTGEIVEQKIPNYMEKKVIDRIREMNIDELADFICDRCNGGCGCAGICDLAIKCKISNKHQICAEWLNTKT